MVSLSQKKNQRAFLVKSAGGAASQCLALMSAIYVSKKINRPFQIKHYPYSTGGYFPLAIRPLLSNDEVFQDEATSVGFREPKETKVGAIIENHPLLVKRMSFEKLLILIRMVKLENILNLLRGEWSIDYSMGRLSRTPRFVRQLSGGYFPFVLDEVNGEMHSRFNRAGIPSPYQSVDDSERFDVVIHYRLGDKRTTYSHKGIMGDGIVDPKVFKEILNEASASRSFSNLRIYVVSDEPMLAKSLLAREGIEAEINFKVGNLWDDLTLMSKGRIVICPWSTVSQFALTFLLSPGTEIYFPKFNSRNYSPRWQVNGVKYYTPRFLPEGDPVYNSNYQPPADAHQIYRKSDSK